MAQSDSSTSSSSSESGRKCRALATFSTKCSNDFTLIDSLRFRSHSKIDDTYIKFCSGTPYLFTIFAHFWEKDISTSHHVCFSHTLFPANFVWAHHHALCKRRHTHPHTHTVTETHVDTCTHPHAAKDARDVTSTSCPPCVAHCKLCRVPSEAEDLCQSGFSCKMNSRQNPKRFVQDIIANPDPEHAASWEATKSHLQVRKPKFALLENSAGLLCPPQSLKVSNSRDGF